MNNIFLLGIILIFSMLLVENSYSKSSSIDSLKQCALTELNDTSLANIYYSITQENLFTDKDSCLKYSFLALHLYQKHNHKLGTANTYRNIGISYAISNELDSAEFYFIKAKDIYSSLHFNRGSITMLNNLGILNSQQKNYPVAIQYMDSVIKILKDKNDKFSKVNLAKAYGNKAPALNEMGLYEESIRSSLKSLDIYNELNSEEKKLNVLINIGNSFSYINEHKKAIEYFKEAKSLALKYNNTYILSKSLNNIVVENNKLKNYSAAIEESYKDIHFLDSLHLEKLKPGSLINQGIAFTGLKKLEKAEESFKEALAISEKFKMQEKIMSSHSNLGTLYYDMGKIDLAKKHCLIALEQAEYQQNKDKLIDIYNNLSNIYKKKGNYKKALEYTENHCLLKDSLENIEKKKNILSLESRFKNKEISQQNKILIEKEEIQKKEIHYQNNIKNLLIFSISITLILLAISYYFYSKTKASKLHLLKKNKELLSEREKELKRKKEESVLANKKADIKFSDDKKEELISKVEYEFNENKIYSQNISLDFLAEKLNTNTSYLSALFNSHYQKTFSDFVNEYRVIDAMRMMEDSAFKKYSISAIGQMAGFTSDKTFSRAFNKFAGLSPSYFRKKFL